MSMRLPLSLKQKILFLLLLFSFGGGFMLQGQIGFFIPSNKDRVDIRFEYINHFIILKVDYNGILPLNFIFDTGAEHTVLTKKDIASLFIKKFDRKFTVLGSDLTTELTAYLVRNVQLSIQDKIEAPHQDILVLDEDYFNFDQYVGLPIHGVLSANVFARYLIKINYDKGIISLYRQEEKKSAIKGFEELPLLMNRNKPYVEAQVRNRNNEVVKTRLLVDTGASLSLILFPETDSLLKIPENAVEGNIGRGLGGFLEGFTGRVAALDLGPTLHQKEIVTFFQKIDTTGKSQYLNDRNGLIGNVLLKRFQVMFDYQNNLLYLKPGKGYEDAYKFDRSGLQLLATGKALNTYIVQDVLPNSPAKENDIQVGDKILSVNYFSARLFTLQSINRKLQRSSGRKIRLKIERKGKKIIKKIVLRDLL